MWFIPSIPFWLIGLWCMWQAGCAVTVGRPNESRQSRNERTFWNLIAAGFVFYVAVKIAS